MKLPEALGRRSTGRGFHSAFATSFSIEFAAVEEILLPQFWASGASNIWIAADDRMSALALSDGSILPQQLGRDYALHEVIQPSGVFHPKVFLQLGRDAGRAIISSANSTAAGLAGNVEVATEIECSDQPGPEQDFICSVWRFIVDIGKSAEGAARDAIDWAADRTPWLRDVAPQAVQELSDGSLIQFLTSPAASGIGTRFSQLAGGAQVEHLIVVSPYWDESLAGLANIAMQLQPSKITVLIDPYRSDFPAAAAMASTVTLIDVGDWQKSRYKHAKVLIAQTGVYDHVLTGSANCTAPALGSDGFSGSNTEACVYRRLERDSAVQALGLDELIARPRISPASLAKSASQQIPLQSLASTRPGKFAIEQGALSWRPPASPDWAGGQLRLFDANKKLVVEASMESAKAIDDRLIFHIDDVSLQFAHLAQVVLPDRESTIAPVTHRNLLAAGRRESTSGKLARSTSVFEHAEGLELFLLDAFGELQIADLGISDANAAAAGAPQSKRAGDPGSEPTHLSYDEFMSERTRREAAHVAGDNLLAGTHCDGVRALLNRLIGDSPDIGPVKDEDTSWMDLGDEAQAQGIEQPDKVDAGAESGEPIAVRPADGASFKKAVKAYMNRAADTERPVGPSEVLRLRLLLMTILWNARCEAFPKGLACTTDDTGWPRLCFRAIAAFFCGRSAPVRRLVFERQHLEMPVDFMECWSTAIWTIEAIGRTIPPSRSNAAFLALLPKLRAEVTQMLSLDARDFASNVWQGKWTALEKAFGGRLFSDEDRQQAA